MNEEQHEKQVCSRSVIKEICMNCVPEQSVKEKYVSLFFIFSFFFEHVSQFPSKKREQGWRKQPGDGSAKLSTIPRITGTQASRGVWGHAPPGNF